MIVQLLFNRKNQCEHVANEPSARLISVLVESLTSVLGRRDASVVEQGWGGGVKMSVNHLLLREKTDADKERIHHRRFTPF